MSINPQIDAMAGLVKNAQGLISALDGTTPIVITIGQFTLTVDPATNFDAYTRGADLLRTISNNTIAELYSHIAPAAVEVALATLEPTP